MSKYILNTMYLKAKYVQNDGANKEFVPMKRVCDDALLMVIKDDETNTSEIKIIERPTIEYFTVKKEYQETVNPWQELYMDKSMLDSHVVEYTRRDYDICNFLGIADEYSRKKKEANRRYFDWMEAQHARNEFKNFMNQKVYMSPFVYDADENLEVYWKTKLTRENGWVVPPKQLNLSFYDIETLIARFKTKVDQNNPIAPINIITYCNTKKKHFYALVLRLQEVREVQSEIERDIQKYITEYEIDKDFEGSGYELKIVFFDSEILLIKAFFQLLHEDKPDFALAWNNNYDNKYMIGRAKILGLKPADLFCHPDIPEKYRGSFQFCEDPGRQENDNKFNAKAKKGEFSRLWDWIVAPGYTCFLDQMSLYSNLRKRYIKRSYKLGAIASEELGVTKVDLHEFGITIRNAVFKDFKRFLKYSIRDTLLLDKLEAKNEDVKQYISLTDNTDLRMGTHESMIIRNTFYNTFLDNDQIIGNTVDYGVSESVQGAVVQDPSVVDVEPVIINGHKTRIYLCIVDFDAKSLYPSLINQHQIGKENHAYRVISIVDKYGKLIMNGERFNSLLQTKDVTIVDLAHELYGLPNVEDVLSDVEEKLFDAVK